MAEHVLVTVVQTKHQLMAGVSGVMDSVQKVLCTFLSHYCNNIISRSKPTDKLLDKAVFTLKSTQCALLNCMNRHSVVIFRYH